jgi:soluble lytic murein transglycosylase
LLKPHHKARLDMLLWRGRTKEAATMFSLVGEAWTALARARIALRKKEGNVDTLIGAVPEALRDNAGLAYERFLWRARKGRVADAVELLLERTGSPDTLGEPSRWAGRRRSLARQMMRAGDGLTAYRVASSHHLVEGAQFADLEWLSGYLALRYLNDPATALAHFQSFRIAVQSPISLGRAGYWEGRAYEALGDAENARNAYAFGSEYQTGFYGQLAAQKAGAAMDPRLLGDEVFPDWREAEFMGSQVLQGALLLYAAGEESLARRFFLQVAEGLDRTGLGQLADLVFSLGNPHIALMIAKQGAKRGLVIHNAYYPLHGLAAEELPVPGELALAIARRESEFNPVVKSGVGAQGLMQLMPRTAKSVAEDLGLQFDAERLLGDWRYNAQLGSTYLARLIEEFGTSPVLVAAGYNAGPSRVRKWIGTFGDPRTGAIDVVDWIEHIPFRETRNYVMRVAESLPIYRARLTGKITPPALAEELKGGI